MSDIPTGFSVVKPQAQAAGDIPAGFSVVDAGASAPAPTASPDQDLLHTIMRQNSPAAAAARSVPLFGNIVQGVDALTGGRASEALAKIATNLGNSALDAVKLPGEVLSGNAGQPTIDPSTGEVNPFPDDMVARGANAAGFMLGGETPAGAGRLVTPEGGAIPAKVMRAVQRDQVPLDDVGAKVAALGPAGKVADIGPNTQALASGIATQPGEASTTVTNSLRARQRDATNRVPAAINDVLGPATPPSELQASVKTDMKALGPEYEQVLSGAPPVDTSAIAADLDAEAADLKGPALAAVQSVRGMLNANGTAELDTSASALLQTRNAIDTMLKDAKGTTIHVLGAARRQVDDLLAASVPGIKDVDAKYHELARQSEAVDAGGNVLDAGKSAVWPQENAAAVAEGVQPHGALVGPSAATFRLTQGARADIERIVGTKANDRVALAGIIQGESDWNPQKLAQLFGQDRADRIMQIVDNERQMADTENKALAGSKTAATLAAQADVTAAERKPGTLRSLANLRFGDAAFHILDKLNTGRASHARELSNQQIADIIMGSGDWRVTAGASPTQAPLPVPQRRQSSDEEMKAAVMRGLN